MDLRSSLVAIALLLAPAGLMTAAERFTTTFSTYIGGTGWEHLRDVAIDSQGNIIAVGGTQSGDFPIRNGFQTQQDKTGKLIASGGGLGSAGYCDAIICKFSPTGQLLWSSYLGGPNYDRAYAVEVDAAGYIYVAGRAGPGFPVTAGAFQTTFQGSNAGIYGMQNGFIAKIKPDGSSVVWASYVGVNQLCRDLVLDSVGNVVLPMSYQGSGPLPPAAWFANAYGKTPKQNNLVDVGWVKVRNDGTAVQCATWISGSGSEVNNAGVRVDRNDNVFLNFSTKGSTDLPTTPGCADATYNGGDDCFLAKFSPDGSQLLFGTYFGGSATEEGNSTHNLAIDGNGNAYLATFTFSSNLAANYPGLPGLRKTLAGSNDCLVAKFTPTGALAAWTYVGGTADDGCDGVTTDQAGNVYFSGSTASTNWPLSALPLQSAKAGGHDAFLCKLSTDLDQVLYSTFLGGPDYDYGRCSTIDAQGNWYLVGSCGAEIQGGRGVGGWPCVNAYQSTYKGGVGRDTNGGSYAGDAIVAKFTPNHDPQVATATASPGTITLPTSSVSVQVTASDPDGDVLTYAWSQLSGPAAAIFANATAASTTATFSTAGSYTLQVVVSDGALQASRTVVVSVQSAINQAPQISAATATPGTITLPTTAVALQATASDPDGDALTYAWSQISGPVAATFANATAASATATFGTAGSYTLQVMVSDGALQASRTVVVSVQPAPVAGLVAHWKLDEIAGTTAADASGNGNAGTLLNGPVWGAGLVGGALTCDGVNDYVKVANSAGFAVNQAVSIALWVKRADLVARNMRLVNKPIGGVFYKPTFDLQFSVDAGIGGSFYSTSGKWIGVNSGTPISDTAWHHVAIVLDVAGGTASFYLDGSLTNQTALQGAVPLNGTDPVYLGAGMPGKECFAGALDDVRIYSRALSAAEVDAICAAGAPGGNG